VLLAAAGVAAYVFWPRSERIDDDAPPDPRLTFDTPFRNVRPNVAYVGDAACAPCHADIDATYHRHPMGRSASLPANEPAARFSAHGHVEFLVEPRGDRMVHTELIKLPDGQILATTEAEVVAVIGSGTRGKSYLCQRDGSLWQTGVSWFAEKPGWDASPGFWVGRHARRAVVPECLFCHVNHAEWVPGTLNRYREPIFAGQMNVGCERCHGPGELHVKERTAKNRPDGAIDTSIVNPKHLSPELREDVCRQCHLQGEHRLVRRGRGPFDYRPGLPLELFVTVYVRHPEMTDYHKSVGQVEQSAISKCSAGSGGRFGCTSCHDPHAVPAPTARDDFYRNRCLNCHQEKGCNLPIEERKTRNDACAACHMPKSGSSNIVHTAVTDHRILRRPGPETKPKESPPPGELPLMAFAGTPRWPDDAERSRDLAVALSRYTQLSSGFFRDVSDRFGQATAQHRGDVEAWEGLATMRMRLGDGGGAMQAAEFAVKARPERERALAKAVEAALQAGRPEAAVEFAQRALEANPGNPDHRYSLALALIGTGKFADAESELRTVIAGLPNHTQARAALAVAMYKLGRAREAVAELDKAAAIYPRDGPELRNWFSSRIR
jgi:predicted CXXCH cytochrome family protein